MLRLIGEDEHSLIYAVDEVDKNPNCRRCHGSGAIETGPSDQAYCPLCVILFYETSKNPTTKANCANRKQACVGR